MKDTWNIWIVVVLVTLTGMSLPLIPSWSLGYTQLNYVDTRSVIGISYGWSVLSSLLLVLVGIWGLWEVSKRQVNQTEHTIYKILFYNVLIAGIVLALYHWKENEETFGCVAIATGMTLFSLILAVIIEWVPRREKFELWIPLVMLGGCILGSLWLLEQFRPDNLRFYASLVYLPVLFAGFALVCLAYVGGAKGIVWLMCAVIFSGIGRMMDALDRSVLFWTGFVSGHTLEHVAFVIAAGFLVLMFRVRHSKEEKMYRTYGVIFAERVRPWQEGEGDREAKSA